MAKILIVSLNQTMPIGKCKGMKVKHMIELYPVYSEWAFNNLKGYKFSEAVKNYLTTFKNLAK